VSHEIDPTHEELTRMLMDREHERERQSSGAVFASQAEPLPRTRLSPPPSPSATATQSPSPARSPAKDWSKVDPLKLSIDGLEKLFASVKAGDERAKAAFTQFMDCGGSLVWRQAGDLAKLAERSLLKTVFNASPTLCVSGSRKFQALRDELAVDNATPLEKLAIERVVLTTNFASAIDVFVALQGPEGLLSAKLAQTQQIAERRVNDALKALKTAREISRSAMAGPLRLFGSRPREAEAPLKVATA
jgi:hypothetical protein